MKKILALAALMLCMHEAGAVTPGYYVITPYPEEDETTLDFYFWNVKAPNSPAVYSPEIAVGHGVNSRWYTELYASDIHTDSGGTSYSSMALENDFMLTQGQYPFDLAIHTLVTRYHQTDRGVGFEFGPVLQADMSRVQLNANIFFERAYQAASSAPPNRMQMKYQWQAKYRWKPQFAYGLQGFGELGEWRDWSPLAAQSHRAGPAIFTIVRRASGQEFKLEAAYLFGKIFDKEAKTFSLRAHYEF